MKSFPNKNMLIQNPAHSFENFDVLNFSTGSVFLFSLRPAFFCFFIALLSFRFWPTISRKKCFVLGSSICKQYLAICGSATSLSCFGVQGKNGGDFLLYFSDYRRLFSLFV
jgi:hypothetical protein